jgi:hypothetical protein
MTMTMSKVASMKLGLARPPPILAAFLPAALAVGCSGANPSALFDAVPPTASAGGTSAPPQSSPPEIDGGGAVDASPAKHDAGTVAPSVDAAPPPDVEDAMTPLLPPDAAPSTATCPIAGESANVIDDGSSAGSDAQILSQCGRGGPWYSFNDGASTQSPSPSGSFGPFLTTNPPAQAHGYVRTWGTLSVGVTGFPGQSHWGAGIGFDINSASGTSDPYDATAGGYQGLSFWILAGSANKVTTLQFLVPTSETAAYTDGAYHAFTVNVPAPGAWTKVTIAFTSLAQPPWTVVNERVPFDASAIVTLQWNLSPADRQALPFEVSIGDVELW